MVNGGVSFDVNSITITNVLGVLLLGTLLSGNLWRLRDKSAENVSLMLLIFFALSNCVVDPLVYTLDGFPGPLSWIMVTFGNSWLYFAQLSAAICWVLFFCFHTYGHISTSQRVFLATAFSLGIVVLVVNFFVPIVFDVSTRNVYCRKSGYFFFAALDYGVLLDSIVIYCRSRIRGGALKFFPVWVYVVPVIFGGVIQSLFYGISVTAVCLAISVAGVLASLQNELIFRDSLTGLYNRTYLDFMLKFYRKKRSKTVTGIMLDLNAFKSINDNYGHAIGDEALVKSAEIFRCIVKDLGIVIRYAGDEFIILINSQEDRVIASCMSEIRRTLQEFNRNFGAPYKLAVSMGSCKVDFDRFSIDAFINEIDKRMYEDKKVFYARNAEYDRRNC